MKKAIALSMIFAFIIGVPVPVFAGLDRSVEKITHGTLEIVKSPVVLYDHTKTEMDGADFKPVGLVKGLITSPFHMIKEAGHGAIEVATFPIE